MALTKFKVINITSGRLELRPYKIVLDPNGWAELAAPIADEINWLLGLRFVKIEPVIPTKVQPFTLAEPSRPTVEKRLRRERNDI